MAGLQSGEGRMMIDSVIWAQYINVTDRQQMPRQLTALGGKIVKTSEKNFINVKMFNT